MIRKRIRHINRYRDIASALIRHGFGFIVQEIDVFHMLPLPVRMFQEPASVPKKSVAYRIRLVVQELGPTFVKLGQLASTRPDVFPEEMVRELEKLQDQVEPFEYEEVCSIIETELDMHMDEIFTRFSQTPLAAASIGQVHLAELSNGERVAVKVQRPDIEETIRTDFEILQNLALLAENRFEWARRYQVVKMIQEFGKSLLQELDYTIEARNTETIAKQFANDSNIYIPAVHWAYSTTRVMVMEYVDGIKVSHDAELVELGYNKKKIAQRFTRAMLHQIFIEGFFHADPHPGNIMVLPDERIAFIDFGMIGRLTPEMKQHLSSLIIALMRQSTDGIIKTVLRMGIVKQDVNTAQLRKDINILREKYYGVPLSEVSLGEAVNDLFDTANRHQIQIPVDLILVGKALLTMEGVAERLDPEISMVKLAEPFGRRLLKDKFHPRKIGETLWKDMMDYGELLVHFPKQLRELMNVVKNGHMRLEISVPELDVFLRKLDRISNRLSFSIVMLAFSIIMMGLIIGSSFTRQTTVLSNVPALEIGFTIAVLMFVWLLYSIFKSGRF
ncbi:ABC transporter [Paenibacillus sambharensis]|uniref:ABC transporter n=1 Tax=Paenibacillus sambharensis TaxID=1803190 RepID=A0A2W1LR54_9BACL|nr:AarF/ABC1/UbiB kinase family protein [Paenibacillus sambharensis]PZD97004.1 ABC transporter [Paenibacillus sambharensis]